MAECLTLKKSNCKNCYKCIRHCPVKSIRFSGNQAYIIDNECIICGQCFVVCPQDAKQITDDIDARYKAFADAEALLINNALVIPRGMSVPAYLATRLNYWEGQYASTGFSNKRLKGIHVLDHYVSMDEYNANRDAR